MTEHRKDGVKQKPPEGQPSHGGGLEVVTHCVVRFLKNSSSYP